MSDTERSATPAEQLSLEMGVEPAAKPAWIAPEPSELPVGEAAADAEAVPEAAAPDTGDAVAQARASAGEQPVTPVSVEAAEPAEPEPEPTVTAAPEPASPLVQTPADLTDTMSTAASATGQLPVSRRAWTRVPFWILGAVWLGLLGAVTTLLWPVSGTGSFTNSPFYPFLAFGGAALVLLGFVTGLVVWLLARRRAGDDERAWTARVVWMRAVGWTFGGVVLWTIALTLLDLHRTGVIR